MTTWLIPGIGGTPVAPSSGYSFVPSGATFDALGGSPAGSLSGQLDQLLDPVTLDYVRTDNGEWAQTADSRTLMMIELDTELGASPYDPESGTDIKRLLREGEPIDGSLLEAEAMRVGRRLTQKRIIADFRAVARDPVTGEVVQDPQGRAQVKTYWTDLASGSPVSTIFQVR